MKRDASYNIKYRKLFYSTKQVSTWMHIKINSQSHLTFKISVDNSLLSLLIILSSMILKYNTRFHRRTYLTLSENIKMLI